MAEVKTVKSKEQETMLETFSRSQNMQDPQCAQSFVQRNSIISLVAECKTDYRDPNQSPGNHLGVL